ncbi:MAG: YeeE/YedE family protein, partial [Proteobacteria bacterium]|nr:YeeE/YedE family protein [Pseudomonadota bacterium]
MTNLFPIAPLHGLPVITYLGISLVLGVFFGFFLERAGFGSAKNLTSIFLFRDFRVFQVMFSAVVTAMIGLQLLSQMGLLNLGLLAFDATYFWSMLVGGVVFGVGFYVGGFCPGTAAVALARGSWDGLAFLVGIVLGIYGFALIFDGVGTEEWFLAFFQPADAVQQTLYGASAAWPWALGITIIALVAFKAVPLVEKHLAYSTVEQLRAIAEKKPVPPNSPPAIAGYLLRVGPVLAIASVLALIGLEFFGPQSESQVQAPLAAD